MYEQGGVDVYKQGGVDVCEQGGVTGGRGVLPGDPQPARRGEVGDVGHVTHQLQGVGRGLGVPHRREGQREGGLWGRGGERESLH